MHVQFNYFKYCKGTSDTWRRWMLMILFLPCCRKNEHAERSTGKLCPHHKKHKLYIPRISNIYEHCRAILSPVILINTYGEKLQRKKHKKRKALYVSNSPRFRSWIGRRATNKSLKICPKNTRLNHSRGAIAHKPMTF